MKHRSLLVLVLVLVLSLFACSSDDESPRPKAKPVWVFEPAATPAGVSLTLRQKELGPDRLVLELVGHSLQGLYGTAFRLSYDPAVLSFEKLDSPSFPLALGSAKTPGLLVGTVSEKGTSTGKSGGELVLATLTFAITQAKPSAIGFVTSRSALVGEDGKPIASASFAGGELVKN